MEHDEAENQYFVYQFIDFEGNVNISIREIITIDETEQDGIFGNCEWVVKKHGIISGVLIRSFERRYQKTYDKVCARCEKMNKKYNSILNLMNANESKATK